MDDYAQTVVIMNADRLWDMGVPNHNFWRSIDDLAAYGVGSVCVDEARAPYTISVDYRTNGSFMRAMEGYEPVVRNGSVQNLTPAAEVIKDVIDDRILSTLRASGIQIATGIEPEIRAYESNTDYGYYHQQGAYRAGVGCPDGIDGPRYR